MIKIRELLRQRYELKLSYRAIATSLNISSSTVSDYLCRARASQLSWPVPAELSDEALYARLFLPSQSSSPNKVQPDWQTVHHELTKKGVTLMLLWPEYRDSAPDGLGYSQFCHHYKHYRKTLNPVMRQQHKAGEKVFVDYAGMTMPYLDITTGEIREAQLFVGSLGASQYTFVHASATQQLPDFLASHQRMFAYFGGVSEMIVPDNLKSAVTKAHRYDPDINANYQHFSEHYGVAIVPARVRAPKDKAKVENAVGCIERQILAPLRHYTFTSITEINAAITERLNAFNAQRFQKMDTSRLALFEKIDKPALKPLPKTPYQYATYAKATVNIDYHIAFENNYYSVPYQYIKKKIVVRANQNTVECFYKNTRIAIHQRCYQRYRYITCKQHMPASHQAHLEWTPERIVRWAKKTGDNTALFVEQLIASKPFPQQAFRPCLGLLRLGKRFGEHRLEKACYKARLIGMERYQQVETLLKNKLEEVDNHDNVTHLIPNHHNIRGSTYYR